MHAVLQFSSIFLVSGHTIWKDIQMLELGKAENAFSSFLGRTVKIPVLFLCSKSQDSAKPTNWGNYMQTQLCLKYILEVNWTTTLISDICICTEFQSWTTLHCKLWLKLFEIEMGTVWIRNQTQNKSQINIQRKCSDHSFSLHRLNFH